MGKCDRGIDPIRSEAEYSKKKKKHISIKRYERSADLTARSSLSQLIATCNEEVLTKIWSDQKFPFPRPDFDKDDAGKS